MVYNHLPSDLVNLNPKEKMGRNELCWCGSGIKWKNCHYDRANQESLNVFQQLAQFDELFTQGYCLHPEASPTICSDIAKSHTIQKRGGLKAIAENHHVLSSKYTAQRRIMMGLQKNKPELLSTNRASTFPGFCGFHDNKLFEPAEKGSVQVDKFTCALLSYRAICLERYNKERALAALTITRNADKGRPFEYQCSLQQYLTDYSTGLRLGLRDAETIMKRYRTILNTSDSTDFQFYAIEFEDVLPIVCSGAFSPNWDFQGNSIQMLKPFAKHIENTAMNITSFNGKGWIIFGWTGQKIGAAWNLVESFRSLAAEEKADAAIKFALEYIENTYMKPSWWNELPTSTQNELLNRILTGLPSRPDHQSFKPSDTASLSTLSPCKEISNNTTL